MLNFTPFTPLLFFCCLTCFLSLPPSLPLPVVYFYFFATGIGIQWPRILRPYITSMQILQFCTGLPYLWVVYSQKISQDGGECATAGRSYSFLFQFVYVGIVLGLFLHFFIMSYVKPKKKSSKKTA